MLRNRAKRNFGFLEIFLVFLIAGCSIPETAPARYNCTWIDPDLSWYCLKDGVKFNCEYETRRGQSDNGEY